MIALPKAFDHASAGCYQAVLLRTTESLRLHLYGTRILSGILALHPLLPASISLRDRTFAQPRAEEIEILQDGLWIVLPVHTHHCVRRLPEDIERIRSLLEET